MLSPGAATLSPNSGPPPGEPGSGERAGPIDRALPRGMCIATSVWIVAFVARLPQITLDSRWLLALLLIIMALSALWIGFRTRSILVTTASLLFGGLINCLLVSSAIHSGDSSTEMVSRVSLADWAWIPGNLVAAGLIGLLVGAIGKWLAGGRRAPMANESSTQSQSMLAVLAIVTTLCLIAVGSLVTSLEVGLSVPDWPTSYGYNMFLFPFTKMVGGIYYEHAHRLIGTLVGMQVMTLCIWLWLRPPQASRSIALSAGLCSRCGYSIRGLVQRQCPECGTRWTANDETHGIAGRLLARSPRFVRRRPFAWLGTLSLLLVIGQGMLGGFRVTFVNRFGDGAADVLAVFHACTAQLFLLGATLLAFVLWRSVSGRGRNAPLVSDANSRRLGARIGTALVLLAFCQTAFGAIARHFALDWALLVHVLGALAVVLAALALTSIVIMHASGRLIRTFAYLLIASVVIQVLLGATSWWFTTRLDRLDQILDMGVTAAVSAHVIVGALILLEAWVLLLALLGDEAVGEHVSDTISAADPALGASQLQRGLA